MRGTVLGSTVGTRRVQVRGDFTAITSQPQRRRGPESWSIRRSQRRSRRRRARPNLAAPRVEDQIQRLGSAPSASKVSRQDPVARVRDFSSGDLSRPLSSRIRPAFRQNLRAGGPARVDQVGSGGRSGPGTDRSGAHPDKPLSEVVLREESHFDRVENHETPATLDHPIEIRFVLLLGLRIEKDQRIVQRFDRKGLLDERRP